MQLQLKITTGPHAGQKIVLRSGQIARVGRTEWADFSFPRDAELADVHFAVRCDLHSAQVRGLAADRPLFVNEQQVGEAPLSPGDVIKAGKTAFSVIVDGQAASAASPKATVSAAAATVAGSLAAMTATPQEREPTAAEIAEQLKLGDEAAAVAAKVKTGPELVQSLAAEGKFSKAVRVQAHLLPKRHSVWWGIVALRAAALDGMPAEEAAALDAAAVWVEDPTEKHRRAAESAAGKTKFDGPGSWLAMAAFWSGGSIAAPDMGDVPPDEKLTGQGVTNSLMIAAVYLAPGKAKERYRAFLEAAKQVASGEIPLPEKK